MSISKTIEYCEELIATDSLHEDCLQRNVIGRAYYHAFYEVRHHLEKRLRWFLTNKNCGVHEQLYSRFAGYPQATTGEIDKRVAEELRDRITKLIKLRTAADYKLNLAVSREMAEFSILESKAISEAIAEFKRSS